MGDLESENELLEDISARFDTDGWVQRERRVWVKVSKENLISMCKYLKETGFEHLSAISVTDWLKDGEFELIYHLWSYERKTLLTIKTRIDRENPIAPSISPIWSRNAQVHEREMHEMFGVEFEGNDDLTPLFLEDWQGPPPFRKDFDWREYARKEYYNKDNEREAVYYE